jgi:hypothetical protein
MKFFTLAFAILSCGQTVMAKIENPLLSELTFGVKEHPIGKVIKLLEELKEKAKVEGEEEEVTYQKFKNWCDNSKKELGNQIGKEKDEIEELKQSISAKEELIAGLESDIEFLTKQLEEQTVSGDEAKKIRDEQNKEYEQADKDFDSTIKAIEEVITSLKDTKSATDKLLLSTKSVRKVLALAEGLVSEKDQQMLASLLTSKAAPKVEDKVYTFKSGNVIELLESLKEKFEMDKEEATKAETAALNEYNVAKGAREDALKAAEKAKDEKETLKGEAETALEEMKATLSETEDDLAANEKALEKTTTLCKLKADEWADRQTMRANEIKAMDTAMEILAKVQGVRHEVPQKSELMQNAPSFLQIDDPKTKAVKILVSESQKLHVHSKALQNLINEIKQHKEGPFDKIIQMIQKMIFRLMAEQKDEDDHKNWCDAETEGAETSKEHNEKKKEELELKIEEGETKVQELTEDITTLTDEVAELTSKIKESTEIRNQEHEENLAAIQDAQDAQAAISKAVAVLTEYYEKAGKQGFIQLHKRAPVELGDTPDTWDSSYTGVSDPTAQPDGIVSVLESVSEDFAKMEADTKAQEATDQKAYDEELTSNMMDKAEKEQSIQLKTHEKTRLQDKLKNWNGQKKHVVAELETVLQYLKDLEGACGEGEEGATYEDRKKARTEEIEALREAQNTLTDAFKDSKKEEFLQKKATVQAHH